MTAVEVSVLQEEAENILSPVFFHDCYEIQLSKPNQTLAEIGMEIFTATPRWVGQLMWLRNRIVKIWDLKGSRKGSMNYSPPQIDPNSIKIGERLGMFTLQVATPDEVILGEDDYHLDFRISMKKPAPDRLHLLTVVKANNRLGRNYMRVIEPFHRLVVRAMMSKAAREKRI